MKKRLITAALPYINNVPHMGHMVGSHLPADIFYRYCIQKGYDTAFVGGSDEHGTPSVIAAKNAGMPVREFVDKLHLVHEKIYKKFQIDYTNYSRTSTELHSQVVQQFFKAVEANGYISKGLMKMYYCETDKMFLLERFIVGKCPKCGYEDANSDQCEKCGYMLNQLELVEPKCKLCGNSPILKDTEHLYLDLDRISDSVEGWLESKKANFRPHVYSEAKKWIKEGLKQRSITRDMQWGVPVPVAGFENKVFYVWFDAPIAYITFTKEINKLEEYWLDKDTEIFHFLGKDNIPFHTIFWPAMLIANGNFNMPHNVVGYNYLNFRGEKFSKSKGVGVFCYNLLNSEIDISGLRFYLTSILPETKDSDFKWDGYKGVINSELIGNFANLFNRTLSMIWRQMSGTINIDKLELNDNDKFIIEKIKEMKSVIGDLYEKVELREAYKKILEYSAFGNAYIDHSAPWKHIKEGNVAEAQKVLYLLLNLCKSLCIVAHPIMPEAMQDMYNNQLNIEGSLMEPNVWEKVSEIDIPLNFNIKEPRPLFTRVDDEQLEQISEHFSISPDLNNLLVDKK